MDLNTYIAATKTKAKPFAKNLGITYEALRRLRRKDYFPSKETAKNILRLTRGLVSLRDLYTELFDFEDEIHKQFQNPV